MQAAAAGEAEGRQRVLAALVHSVLTVPLVRPEGASTPGQPAVLTKTDGTMVALAFTDPQALLRWTAPPVEWASMHGAELLQLVAAQPGATLALNPNGPFGGELQRREVEMLAERDVFSEEGSPGLGINQLRLEDPSKVTLRGSDQELPEEIRRSVQQILSLHPVRRAYLLTVSVQGGGRHLALGLVSRSADLDFACIAKGLGTELRKSLPAGASLDLLPLTSEQQEQLRRAQVPPVYEEIVKEEDLLS